MYLIRKEEKYVNTYNKKTNSSTNRSYDFYIGVWFCKVAMTLPYMFLSGAFAPFKKKDYIHKPFEVFKTYNSALIASVIVTLTVGFANVFTIIEPAMNGDMESTIWCIAGPLFFSVLALIMYSRYEKRMIVERKISA